MTFLPLHRLPPLLFFFLISLPFLVISQSNERSTLLNLKRVFGDPPSLHLWNDTSSPCDWSEITCVSGNITEINFNNQNFTVELPTTICDFPNLESLDLSYNYFPGEFPTVLYNCTKLKYLDLSQNSFNGSLPSDIDRLSHELEHLDLAANGFSGDIPKNIGLLSKLKVLNLYQSDYDGTFPSEIGDLSELEELRLADNDKFKPAKIPIEFGKLKKLKYLFLREMNLIGEIPAGLFENTAALEHVDLSVNKLTGQIPDGLFRLNNLTALLLYANDLTGEIPKSISATNLEELDLSANNLTGSIPEPIGNLTKLEYLNLFNNAFTGEIPVAIGKLPGLKEVKLFTNKLTGEIPADFGFYSRLERFEVSENQLTGKLPVNLCKGGNLLGVVVFSNNLTGEIPESLGNCGSLLTVQLQNNRFSGEFPSQIWTARGLDSLMISNNSFTGKLPEVVAWNLSRIEIQNNEFSGEIPKGIGSWSSLAEFKAGNNRLSGEIPKELTALSNLISIFLDSNDLSGELPEEIISWKSLTTLSLSKNKLTGKIPRGLGLLPRLINLDLSENQLSGEIPKEIGNLELTILDLSSNKLIGEIPYQLNNLAYESGFLNNSNLCADKPVLKLPDCRKVLGRSKRLPGKIVAMIIVIVVLLVAITLLVTFFVIRDHTKKQRRRRGLETWKLTSFQRVDFAESDIVSNMMEHNVIGSGGSGKVYKIFIESSGQYVAVKRIWGSKKLNQKLEKEFNAEVEILGTIRHANIVKLLCCISREDSKLLVYEYMEKRSLDQWLHGKKKRGTVEADNLSWPQRLNIAVAAAQGLCYMHHDCSPAIIHRDVKSSNILLDFEFNAKIADFGLAKMLIKQNQEPHTMSVVAGSFGYIAPEYAYTSKVDEKIDVYSFGVVLLELVTGREGNNGDEHTNLADWSWRHYQTGRPVAEAFDEDISEASMTEEMTTVFKLGLMCTNTLPSHRPSMKEILYVLRQQGSEATKKTATEAHEAPLLVSLSGRRTSNRVEAEEPLGFV
ncbi:hypothetical protein AALP_AA8G241000 [Arabis alpina]|uniref:Protein kinase domain-containing protein n=1 Tax=Arabis alpina TaxID=50452 RepID=A0A087G930_ARAAL|nr:hypothetical protein AALP_AA8G241000 [Arabis alpina]